MTASLSVQVCSVTCCGIINFEQHCTSKKHLRKAAAVAHATVSNNSLFLPGNDATPTASQSSDAANGTTYVGIKAQCRTYCKQVYTRWSKHHTVKSIAYFLDALPYHLLHMLDHTKKS